VHEAADRLAGLDQDAHEAREVEVVSGLDEVAHGGIHEVDPHAHRVLQVGLLLVAQDALHASAAVAVHVQDAEVDGHDAGIRGDREDVAGLDVSAVERVVVERREHVAVHEQERLVQGLDRCQRPRRPERMILRVVGDLDVAAASVAKDCL